MKNVLIGFVVFFSVFGLTAFGKGMGGMFKDDDKIPEWAKEGVEDMYEGGVIEGFNEGDGKEFRGEEPLTRSQMAVMMSRYDKKIRMSAFVGLIHSLNKLDYIDVTDDYAAAAIMAEAGMMQLKGDPTDGNSGNDDPEDDKNDKKDDKKDDSDKNDNEDEDEDTNDEDDQDSVASSLPVVSVEELTTGSLPTGYTYVNANAKVFYLHYVGNRSKDGDTVAVDEWYGPFRNGMLTSDPSL